MWRKNAENLLDFLQQFHDIEMRQQSRLQENDDLFFRRKSVIVSELNLAVEIFAAAFCIKMNDLEMFLKFSNIHVMVRMVLAVFAKARRIAKTAQNMMVFGAIVEIYIPAYRNKGHQKCNQQGSYLQNAVFHAAKIVKMNSLLFTLFGYPIILKWKAITLQ